MTTNARTKMLNKVPIVTAGFWIIKIISTTVGETEADYLAVHVGLGRAVTGVVMTTLLLAAFCCSCELIPTSPGNTG
jgi:uncharacterized membrane-anchored protein